MKVHFLMVMLTLLSLASCEKPEVPEYEYESNPQYTWGYAEFWGPYYAQYFNNNNLLSISLFTDSLDITAENTLAGFGQYLYLEDVFINANDTILPEGEYLVNDSGDPFTIAPGEQLEFDGQKFDVGAMIFYLEKNSALSTLKYITGGKMTVFHIGDKILIVCAFTLKDGKELRGRFERPLPHIDFSEQNEEMPQKAPRKVRKS